MTNFWLAITFLGNWRMVLILNIIIGIFFVIYRKWRNLKLMIISSLSNLLLIEPLKLLVAEPRPMSALILEKSFSFPSGHAYTAVAFYGLLTYLLFKYFKNITIVYFGITFILLIAYSRLYLGVHYWWDVAAGLILGTLWLRSLLRYVRV